VELLLEDHQPRPGGIGDQSVPVVPLAYALLEEFSLLCERHGAHSMCETPARVRAQTSPTFIGQELFNVILGRSVGRAKILAAVTLRRGEIQAQESLRRAEPKSAIGGPGRWR